MFLVTEGDVALAMPEIGLAGNEMAVRHHGPSDVERSSVLVATSADRSVRLVFPAGADPSKPALVARVAQNLVLARGVLLSAERDVAFFPRGADLARRHALADVASGDVQDLAGVLRAAHHRVGR